MSTGVSSTIEGITSYQGKSALARLPIVSAESSDHVGVYCFLNSVFGEPSHAEFRASLEDPDYQPANRLLAKDGQRIVAHAQVLHRICPLGPLRLPAAQIDWLGTTPKLRGRGLGTRLLRTAERRMVQSGALVGWVRAQPTRLFTRLGWAVCGMQVPSCGSAHYVLRSLIEKGLRLSGRRTSLHIRPWLLWEVGGLARLYRKGIGGLFGPFERTEPYWQWLVRRHGFEQLYVAIDGPDPIDMDERKAPVVGYAAIKGAHILELVASSTKKGIAAMLLARICHDAVESGRRSVFLHTPEVDRLHEVFQKPAEPCRHGIPGCGEAVMARVLRPLALMRLMKDVLQNRAAEGGLPPAMELGFRVGKNCYLLSFNDSQLTVTTRKPTHHTVELSKADFARMLLGRIDWDHATAEECVVPRTPEAGHFARTLFPTVPFWKPPLDDLKRDEKNPYW